MDAARIKEDLNQLQNQIIFGRFVVGEKVGGGSFGVIYVGKNENFLLSFSIQNKKITTAIKSCNFLCCNFS
jgi:hypothetical protein